MLNINANIDLSAEAIAALAQLLRDGASADIFYDAHDYSDPDDPEDPDTIAESTIEQTQNAMIEAADLLDSFIPKAGETRTTTSEVKGADQRFSFLCHIDAPTLEQAQAIHATIKPAAGLSIGELPDDEDRYNSICNLAAEHAEEGELEIDEGSVVSEGEDNGAYVMAWKWVSFEDTPLDKEAEGEDEED